MCRWLTLKSISNTRLLVTISWHNLSAAAEPNSQPSKFNFSTLSCFDNAAKIAAPPSSCIKLSLRFSIFKDFKASKEELKVTAPSGSDKWYHLINESLLISKFYILCILTLLILLLTKESSSSNGNLDKTSIIINKQSSPRPHDMNSTIFKLDSICQFVRMQRNFVAFKWHRYIL